MTITNPVCCQTTVIRIAQIDQVGSASHTFWSSSRPRRPRKPFSGPLNWKMNFQTYATASGLSTTGMKSSVRRM